MNGTSAIVPNSPAYVEREAEAIFRAQQESVYRSTDLLFAGLMAVQWLFCVGLSIFVTPRVWNGLVSSPHPHVWESLVLGGSIAALPIYLTLCRPDFQSTRYVMAVAQMLISALIIHLTGGRIESHFHVFGSLAFLAFYRDWKVLIPASIVVLVDHVARGVLVPISVFGVDRPDYWRPLEHIGWVIFEDVFLIVLCLRSTREMQVIAENTAKLSGTNAALRQEMHDRMAAQSALVESEERYRYVVDNTQEVLFEMDRGFKWTFLNRAWSSVSGRSIEECLLHSCLELVHGKDKDAFIQQLTNISAGETLSARFEVRLHHGPDGLKWVDVFVQAKLDSKGNLEGFSGTLMDITERRQAEDEMRAARLEAEKANQAKSEFLSRMSHELRTPLNAILGFGQLLDRKQLPGIQATWVRHITGAGQHLLGLIDQILDVAQLESRHLHLSLEPLRVGDILDEALILMEPVARQFSVEIRPIRRESPIEFVTADRQRLKQVILNLLSNAVKYNKPSGWVEICLGPGTTGDAEMLRVSITDNGGGIAPELVDQVFVPFDRLGRENSAVGGTGLGLPLSKSLIEAMGGKIGLTSSAGEGCTAWIEIPVSDDPMRGLDLNSLTRIDTGPNGRILLYIEDNLSNLKLVEHLLQAQSGVHLITASHGELGLDLAREHQPDLIILDLHLPDVTGWDILGRLRSDSLTKHIPVVVLTADTTRSRKAELLAAGADRYLTKPIDANHFLNTLEEVMA